MEHSFFCIWIVYFISGVFSVKIADQTNDEIIINDQKYNISEFSIYKERYEEALVYLREDLSFAEDKPR